MTKMTKNISAFWHHLVSPEHVWDGVYFKGNTSIGVQGPSRQRGVPKSGPWQGVPKFSKQGGGSVYCLFFFKQNLHLQSA